MWPWLVVIGAWLFIFMILGFSLEIDFLAAIGSIGLSILLLVTMIMFSVWFLQYYQAWPFVPR